MSLDVALDRRRTLRIIAGGFERRGPRDVWALAAVNAPALTLVESTFSMPQRADTLVVRAQHIGFVLEMYRAHRARRPARLDPLPPPEEQDADFIRRGFLKRGG